MGFPVMEQSTEFIIGAIVGLLVWALILSAIISSSVKSKQMLNNARAQTLLLAEMAVQAGCNPDKVEGIVMKAIE